eukprot:473148_1
MQPSTIITIVYASTYALLFIATSIYCLWELKQTNSHKEEIKTQNAINNQLYINIKENKKLTEEIELHASGSEEKHQPKSKPYTGNFCIDWMKSIWNKKKIYWAILPHIFDQATDVGIIYQYYYDWMNHDQSSTTKQTNETINPFYFFVFGISIIIFQRIISTITIYTMTNNSTAAILQFFDVLMVKAVWVNYILQLDEPCNPQRYIELLESCFESSPQIILSMGYILKSAADGHNIAPIFVISTAFSLWSLTSKVASDDRILFDGYTQFRDLGFKFKKKCCCINFNWQYLFRVIVWRYFEISSRVCLCVLLWINIGGLALVVILGIELIICFIFCVIEKTPDAMGNIMYLSFGTNKGYVRYFWYYRIIFFYIYMIMITVFAMVYFDAPKIPDPKFRHNSTINNDLGITVLIYTWIVGCIWPCTLVVMVKMKVLDKEVYDLDSNLDTYQALSTSRDLIGYVWSKRFTEVRQLLLFGYMVHDDYTDKDGNTLLHAVCYGSKGDFDDFLLCFNVNKAQINAKTKNKGYTPLHYAMYYGPVERVKHLVENDANVNETNNDGQTPMIYAATNVCDITVETIKYMISIADISCKDKNGETLLTVCKKHKTIYNDIIVLIEKDTV